MAHKALKLTALLVLLAAVVMAQGCAANYTATQYQHLEASTHLSNAVFLEPRPPALRAIYVEIRNSSGQGFDIGPDISAALSAKGYRVVSDPATAQLRLQVTVFGATGGGFNALQNAPGMAQGGVAAGAVAGALIGGPRHFWAGALLGGLAGAAAESAAGASTQVMSYSVTADIYIGESVRGYEHMGEAGLRRHYTRATSFARQVNLPWETAQPYLRYGLVQAISGLFY